MLIHTLAQCNRYCVARFKDHFHVPGFASYQVWQRQGQLPITRFAWGGFLFESEAGHSLVLGHIFQYVCLQIHNSTVPSLNLHSYILLRSSDGGNSASHSEKINLHAIQYNWRRFWGIALRYALNDLYN